MKRSFLLAPLAGLLFAGCSSSSDMLECSAINTSNLGIGGVKVTSSTALSASAPGTAAASYPAHCKVNGTLNERTGVDGKPYAIGFELRMPDSWNGRFLFQGGGGTDGSVGAALGVLSGGGATTNALSQGYAVVSTDAGHTSESTNQVVGGVLFGLDPQARLDYGYNAVGTLTPVAKRIVTAHYDRAPARSYFAGCSNGGRQGMVIASRFPDQFDGIIAGDPGFNLPKAGIAESWDTQQLMSVSPPPALPGAAFTVAEINTVAAAVNARCDALDGRADGMVNDVAACRTATTANNPVDDVTTCTGGVRTGTCLTPQQKTALKNIFSGPVTSASVPLYSDWPWDPGMAGNAAGFSSWRAWKLENPILGGLSVNLLLGGGAVAYVFTTPPAQPLDVPGLLGFVATANMDTADALINATGSFSVPMANGTHTVNYAHSAMEFMTPPNPTQLTAFKARGKLMVYHGTGDPVFSYNDTLRWYNELRVADSTAASYARLFAVPGMNHCNGGPSTDKMDMLGALVNWVENGTAPASVTATVSPGNSDVPVGWSATRSRPLCAYPTVARYVAGDAELASSFSCQ